MFGSSSKLVYLTSIFFFGIFLIVIGGDVSSDNNVKLAAAISCTEEIRKYNCSLPKCRCSGEDIPGNLSNSQTPQIVFLTFDDALNWANHEFYQNILKNRKNPNGHPITSTFFISHEYTNYSMVHELWRLGHEMALHSITHKSDVTYWATLNKSMWHQEILQQRQQMSRFANIPSREIKGMRAPFLQGGGDAMFSALYGAGGFSWDCSRPSEKLVWPYTHDFASTQECDVPPCSISAYPGFWTVPMIRIMSGSGKGCAMVDSCLPVPKTAIETFQLLYSNFLNHYQGNRAPFGLYIHSAWLNSVYHEEIVERRLGYLRFLDYLGSLKDTYIVSISRAIEWIKRPVVVDKLKDFGPFKVKIRQSQCLQSKACLYKPDGDGGERWFHSCASDCPKTYPWVGNPLGL